MTTAGSAIGSLLTGPIMGIGRWKCLMIANGLVILGSGLSLVPNFTTFLIGRLFYGAACGGFSCVCPKYISEVAPIEINGPAGTISQIMICFGILLTSTIRLYMDIDTTHPYNFIQDEKCVSMIFLFPIFLSLTQILLMISIFNFDSPYMHKLRNEKGKLNDLMGKIYEKDLVM